MADLLTTHYTSVTAAGSPVLTPGMEPARGA
jgi:hypothetical protein